MLSIGIITAGDGYEYLTREVTSGVEDYYMRGGVDGGEAQGWWLGSQREAFGVAGPVVSEEQMKGFFGAKCDPVSGEALGGRFRVFASVAERLDAARAAHGRWVTEDLRRRCEALWAAGERGGPREGEVLAAHVQAARERWDRVERGIVRAGERKSVAGYDLTFSAPKSVSVLWAAAPDRAARDAVRAAHHHGVRAAMSLLEAEGAFVRKGRNGIRQEKASGVLAAAFDHRTSRTGDPQMHTHVATLGMVKDADGTVRALDGRAVFAMSGALSAVYDFYRDKQLVRDLGVRLVADPDTGVREVAGVPESLRGLWSSRRAQITPAVEALKAGYRDAHGREAPRALVAKMAQWATLDTRPAKRGAESTGVLFARWRADARAQRDADLAEIWERATGRAWETPAGSQSVDDVVAVVVGRLHQERSSWTAPNVTQLVYQALERDPRRSDAEDQERARRCVQAILEHQDVLRLTPSLELDLPAGLVRDDGQPVYVRHNSARWASNAALREEEYLVARCASKGRWAASPAVVEACVAAAGGDGPGLSGDQAAAVRGVLASPGAVNVVVGPAGTGKTTTMSVIVAAWQANGAAVLGLAVSQTAAVELAVATGCRAENVAKFLYENGRAGTASREGTAGRAGHAGRWTLSAGQLVIMDEAGMTDRKSMVAVARLCELAGAKLLLVGDHAQLESPDARGSMRLMAAHADTFELGEVHRFAAAWERDASLRLRAGDVTVLDDYAEHGRIYGGSETENDLRAVRYALADHLEGRRVFILAGTNDRAARLAGMFRAGLVAAGQVEAGGVVLADGNTAGVGDRVVARRIRRDLTTTAGGFVTNRAVYQVTGRDGDGGLSVAVVDPATGRVDDTDTVGLPGWYVARWVTLEYAGTNHAAQGGTRCSSHALISPRDTVNSVYVALTRGRHSNIAYVDTTVEGDDGQPKGDALDPVAVLAGILAADSHPESLSALEAQTRAADDAASLATLFPVWQDLEAQHSRRRWYDRIAGLAGPRVAGSVTGAKAWPTLAARLGAVEADGGDPERLLAAALAQRDLGGAVDPAAVLAYRLETTSQAPAIDGDRPAGVDPGGSTPQWVGFQARTITGSEYTPALRQVAVRLDRRISQLGDKAFAERPEWTWALGPAGDEPTSKQWWTSRAATVASYREAFAVTGRDPIGPKPPPARVEGRQWWEHARRALTTTTPHDPTSRATDSQLGAWIQAADRAEVNRPEPARLEQAVKAETEAVAQLAHARSRLARPITDPDTAVEVDGEAGTVVDADGEAVWAVRAATLEAAAVSATRARIEAEAAHVAYQDWELATATVRQTGETARCELSRRHPAAAARGGYADQPTSWVAHQAAAVDRQLAAKRDALSQGENTRRRLTGRLDEHRRAGETVQARAAETLLARWAGDITRLQRQVAELQKQSEQIHAELDRRPSQDGSSHDETAGTRRVSPRPAQAQPILPGQGQAPTPKH